MDALKRSVSAEKAGSTNKKAPPVKKPATKSKSARKPAGKTKARKAG
jgi:DNA end-binding protein Ku